MVTTTTRLERRSRPRACETRRTWPGRSNSWPRARTGPCKTIATTRRAASPASPHQRPEKLGTSSGEESVRPANQRRKASGASEAGPGLDPVACAQRIGNAVGPIALVPPTAAVTVDAGDCTVTGGTTLEQGHETPRVDRFFQRGNRDPGATGCPQPVWPPGPWPRVADNPWHPGINPPLKNRSTLPRDPGHPRTAAIRKEWSGPRHPVLDRGERPRSEQRQRHHRPPDQVQGPPESEAPGPDPQQRGARGERAGTENRHRVVRARRRPRAAGPRLSASGPRDPAVGRILGSCPTRPQPARWPSLHRRRRHHRRRARRPQRPGPPLFDGAPHRRSAVDPQRPAAALVDPERLHGRHDGRGTGAARGWVLPVIIEFRDGGCVLPPAPSDELIAEMMAFLVCTPLDDDVVPMFLEDLHLDGADARVITWADEIPDDVRAESHVVVIGCGESGLLAALRLAQAKLPFTVVEKNGGPGGTWWENRYPGCASRHRQSLLLLLVRTRRPLDRLLAAPRAARVLPAGARRRTTSKRTAAGTRVSTP